MDCTPLSEPDTVTERMSGILTLYLCVWNGSLSKDHLKHSDIQRYRQVSSPHRRDYVDNSNHPNVVASHWHIGHICRRRQKFAITYRPRKRQGSARAE